MSTWKIVYYPKNSMGGARGLALIEAETKQMAMYTFAQQYAGVYHTIESCTKL